MQLQVEKLEITFSIEKRPYKAVEDVSFSLEGGKTLCLVGESGCGKSVTSLALLRLLPKQIARVSSGEIQWNGRSLLELSDREMNAIRGKQMSMIFQEPGTSLNPVLTIGYQLTEALRLHHEVSSGEAKRQCLQIMKEVGISSPENRFGQYPHELSGGMKQRIMIAMALLCKPEVLIADEPTTALDVTISAEILELIRTLKTSHRMAVLLISHDLGVVAEMADEVAVMYAGMIVEKAQVASLFDRPLHPYTKALQASMPKEENKGMRLEPIAGKVPFITEFPSHCRFADRCPIATHVCKESMPPMEEKSSGHFVRCFHA